MIESLEAEKAKIVSGKIRCMTMSDSCQLSKPQKMITMDRGLSVHRLLH